MKKALDSMKADNRVKLLGSTSSTAGGNRAWTISGCTPDKPVIVVFQAPNFQSSFAFVTVSSVTYHNEDAWDNKNASGQYLLGGGTNNGSNAIVLIPKSSVCAIWLQKVGGTFTIRAFT